MSEVSPVTVAAEDRTDERSGPGCRFCGTTLRLTFVDLGMSPLCETYLAADELDRMEPFYPLLVQVCDECLLVQLREYVSPEAIFGEYAYFSSYSESWLRHARRFVESVTKRFALDAGSLVVEVGSNDGYLLQYLVGRGIPVLGIEPAGNVAEVLLKTDAVAVEIDMFDRLPTQFGLVRAGVAPAHPKIKSVIRVYEKTAARDGFRFFGNVDVGREVAIADLEQRYNAIVYAYGTATDRQLGIPGEDLPGSHAATEFVNWYNAHPDFAKAQFDLGCERVVVIGNGNVAADVARMLALPKEELDSTDTADHAIDPLTSSSVKEIVVLGRRGPAQAAFTNPEVRELGELTDADIVVDPAEVELDEVSREYVDSDECDP